MANEEFRRLRLSLDSLEQQLAELRSQRVAPFPGERRGEKTGEGESGEGPAPRVPIAVLYDGRLVEEDVRKLEFEDRIRNVRFRLTRPDDGHVVVEAYTTEEKERVFIYGGCRSYIADGMLLRDAPQVDNYYAFGQYAVVHYDNLVWSTDEVEVSGEELIIRKEGLWGIQASLWVRLELPYPLAQWTVPLHYPRLVLQVNDTVLTVLDVQTPQYRMWHVEQPGTHRCPVSGLDVFLNGSEFFWLEREDRVRILFASNLPFRPDGRIPETWSLVRSVGNESVWVTSALALWGTRSALLVSDEREVPFEDYGAGDPFAGAYVLEDWEEVCGGARWQELVLSVQFDGQTVFPLPPNLRIREALLLVNGVDYKQGDGNWSIQPNPLMLIWGHPSINLSPEDYVVLRYIPAVP